MIRFNILKNGNTNHGTDGTANNLEQIDIKPKIKLTEIYKKSCINKLKDNNENSMINIDKFLLNKEEYIYIIKKFKDRRKSFDTRYNLLTDDEYKLFWFDSENFESQKINNDKNENKVYHFNMNTHNFFIDLYKYNPTIAINLFYIQYDNILNLLNFITNCILNEIIQFLKNQKTRLEKNIILLENKINECKINLKQKAELIQYLKNTKKELIQNSKFLESSIQISDFNKHVGMTTRLQSKKKPKEELFSQFIDNIDSISEIMLKVEPTHFSRNIKDLKEQQLEDGKLKITDYNHFTEFTKKIKKPIKLAESELRTKIFRNNKTLKKIRQLCFTEINNIKKNIKIIKKNINKTKKTIPLMGKEILPKLDLDNIKKFKTFVLLNKIKKITDFKEKTKLVESFVDEFNSKKIQTQSLQSQILQSPPPSLESPPSPLESPPSPLESPPPLESPSPYARTIDENYNTSSQNIESLEIPSDKKEKIFYPNTLRPNTIRKNNKLLLPKIEKEQLKIEEL